MPHPLSPTDTHLLDLLQDGLPLTERPFAALADRLRIPESEALSRTTALKQSVIRQISAIFDSSSLGYRSCLIAAKVPEKKVPHAVQDLNSHPGISHNYRRSHAYNLWYTLAVPPDSRLGLQRTVDLLHHLSQADATRMLPTLKLYKIGVKFDLSDDRDTLSRTDPSSTSARTTPATPFTPTDADKRIIRALQQDLPLVERPFDLLADQAQLPVPDLLAAARRYQSAGQLRRFAAVLRHRAAGFGANAMGVWPVPPSDHDRFGQTAASFSAVSHCYLRPTYDDWPYSIFTMVHAPTKDECLSVLSAISAATGITNHAALFSTEEFKKTRVQYFTPQTESWESSHTTDPNTSRFFS